MLLIRDYGLLPIEAVSQYSVRATWTGKVRRYAKKRAVGDMSLLGSFLAAVIEHGCIRLKEKKYGEQREPRRRTNTTAVAQQSCAESKGWLQAAVL
jgi:hypothetical protein